MSAKKYFVYELKKAIFAIGSIALIMTAITVTSVLTYRYYVFAGDRVESGVEVNAFMGGVLAAVVPVWMFSYKMKKHSADLYYSLPLRRRQILGSKYLLGLIAVYAPFTTSFLLGALAAVIRYPSNDMGAVYYFPAFFASLPALFCIYSIASFVFTRADRIIDGIVFMVFWALAPLALMGVFQRMYHDIAADMYMPTAPLSAVAMQFSRFIEWPNMRIREMESIKINRAVGFPITGIVAVFATVMLFLSEK